jgi:uncharacterized protein YaiI (UPF0178 family)
MKILVDGDACPVKSEIMKVAEQYDIDVVIVYSISHHGNSNEYEKAQKIMVDNESQAADMAIINKVTYDDIVVTGDFGLASLVLAKRACAISFSGKVYDNYNIDKLLFERFLSAEIRRSGGKAKGPSKRTSEDNRKFYQVFKSLILKKMKDI